MMLASYWYNVGSIFTKLIITIYRTVVKVFNLMNTFVTGLSEDSEFLLTLEGVKDSIYVLVAVFMLFRITISMIQYLIDPDKVSDKSVGAGKLIVRIILSFVLLLSFDFIVNFSHQFQEHLLDGESILYKLFQSDSSGESSDPQLGHCDLSKETIESLDDLSDAAMYCYYDDNLYNQIMENLKDLGYRNGFIGIHAPKPSSKEGKNKIVTKIGFTAAEHQTIQIFLKDADSGKSYEELTETEGNEFAENVIASFSNNPDEITGRNVLTEAADEEWLIKSVEQDKIELDVFLCLVTGIVLIFFILILCIEVVIRGLKLAVLEMFAPIAFVSYMNPNDKVLGNWFQKYIGCYLDLFIKIIAIRAGVFLIGNIKVINNDSYGAIGTILLYIGIFVFVKTIPNLISDILGIKNMGGTFKESMNALKTAAGIGVGAIAGGVAGYVSGFGKGASFSTVAGGLLGGTFRGAQGGAKGKLLQGASTQIKRNSAVKTARLDGSKWWDRQRANMGFNVTANDDRRIAEHEKRAKEHSAAVDYADKAKKYVQGELDKGKGDSLTNSTAAKRYRQEMKNYADLQDNEAKIRTDKSRFIDTQAKAAANAAYESKAAEIADIQKSREAAASLRDAKIQAYQDELSALDRARNIDRKNFSTGYYGDQQYNKAKAQAQAAYESKAAEFTVVQQDANNEYNTTLNTLRQTEQNLRTELIELDAKRNEDFYDADAHQRAIEEAEAATEAQRHLLYDKDGIIDKSIEEYYNAKVDSDADLQSMVMDFEATQHVSEADLSDVNIHDWSTVKKGKDAHAVEAARERQQATEIKESEEYQGAKASKEQAKK